MIKYLLSRHLNLWFICVLVFTLIVRKESDREKCALSRVNECRIWLSHLGSDVLKSLRFFWDQWRRIDIFIHTQNVEIHLQISSNQSSLRSAGTQSHNYQ